VSEDRHYGNWAWFCPKCDTRHWLPIHPSPQAYIPGQEPRRPEFEPVNTFCCGQAAEVNPQNIRFVRVEDYPPKKPESAA